MSTSSSSPFSPSVILRFSSYFPRARARIVDVCSKRDCRRLLLLCCYGVLCFVVFFLLFYYHGFAARVSGYGVPQDVTCYSRAWNGCGVNSGDCLPFESDWFPIRCRARCDYLNADGSVVGGPVNLNNASAPAIYEAGSRICHAAAHAGLVSRQRGGCVLMRKSGAQMTFSGSYRNGINSLPFSSWFPASFTFQAASSSYCEYIGWEILGVAIIMLAIACVLSPPPVYVYFLSLIVMFWYVTFTLQDRALINDLWWNGTATFCICLAFSYILYHISFRFSLFMSSSDYHAVGSTWPWKYAYITYAYFAARFACASVSPPSSSSRRPSQSQIAPQVAPLVMVAQLEAAPVPAAPQSTSGPLETPLIHAHEHSPNISLNVHSQHSIHNEQLVPHELEQEHKQDVDQVVRRRELTPPCQPEMSSIVISESHSNQCEPSTSPYHSRPPLDMFFFFVCPFILSCHFSYFSLFLPDVDLDSQFFSHGASAGLITFLVATIICLLILVVFHFKLFWRANQFFQYLLYYFYLFVILLFISLLQPSSMSFHLHHVTAGILLIPLSRFPNRISLAFGAFALGIFVNGLAVWGWSPNWEPLPTKFYASAADAAPPRIMFQYGNTTNTTATVAWSTPQPDAAAIGTSLYMNGVEIFHSTYVDSTYGGGSDPLSDTPRAMLSATYTRSSIESSAAHSPSSNERRDQHVLMKLQSQAIHGSINRASILFRPPSRSVRLLPLPSSPPYLSVFSPDSPPSLSSVSLVAHARAQLGLPAAINLTPLTYNQHTHYSHAINYKLSHTQHASHSRPSAFTIECSDIRFHNFSFNNQTFTFYMFDLINLVPSTTYYIQASYILPYGNSYVTYPLTIQTQPADSTP